MLSKREIEILSFVCLPNEGIAQKLGLDVKTVEKHLANMYAKTNTLGRAHLLVYALNQGILKLEDVYKPNVRT